MTSYWRGRAYPIIAKCIADNPDADEKTLRKIISAAYPFEYRQYHPYKVWCDEVKKQMAAWAKRTGNLPPQTMTFPGWSR